MARSLSPALVLASLIALALLSVLVTVLAARTGVHPALPGAMHYHGHAGSPASQHPLFLADAGMFHHG
jgi:hypothetical protein